MHNNIAAAVVVVVVVVVSPTAEVERVRSFLGGQSSSDFILRVTSPQVWCRTFPCSWRLYDMVSLVLLESICAAQAQSPYRRRHQAPGWWFCSHEQAATCSAMWTKIFAAVAKPIEL